MNSLKRFLFLSALAPVVSSGLAAESVPAGTPPNVILILADDLGFNDISANGGPLKTPNIDRLAASGTRFTRGYSPSATSTPSRFGILTGRYPWRKKVAILPGTAPALITPGTPTLATLFKSKNYATAAIGKWHLGLGDRSEKNWNDFIAPGPNQIGFDFSFVTAATNDRVPCVYFSDGYVVNRVPEDPIEVSYAKNFEGEPTGRANPELLKMHPSPNHGHDGTIVNGISRIGFMKGGNAARWIDETMAEIFSEKALGFLKKQQNSGTPFFLYYALHQPHVPRAANQKFSGKSGFGPRGDAVLEADAQVGELLDFLEKTGLRENTLIVLTSDNGPVLDDGYCDFAVERARERNFNPAGKFRGGKYSLFEGGTRVPLIVSFPGTVPQNAVSENAVSTLDLFADFAGFLGAELPEGIDSQNYLDALLNKSGARGREEFVVEAMSRLALRSGDWVYIPAQRGPAVMGLTGIETGFSSGAALFDIVDDPSQTKNLIYDFPQLAEKFRLRLNALAGTDF